MSASWLVLNLWRAEWRAHPLRLTTGVLALAFGVALGYAVHLVNQAAIGEFAEAVSTVAGRVDLEIRGPAAGFDDRLYDAVAVLRGIAALSPVLELDVSVAGETRTPRPLRLYGVDALAAADISPALVGHARIESTLPHFSAGLFLSAAAQSAYSVRPGDSLSIVAGHRIEVLRVVGDLPLVPEGQRVGALDIAAAQQLFAKVGRINRIDVRLTPGVTRRELLRQVDDSLPPGTTIATPEDNLARTANLSRAYRVNLTVLALVALFTGAFLVFATQALSVVRRRSQLALLRVLGLTRVELMWQIVTEGALLGLIGGAIGIVLGYLLATTLLEFAGPDLGGGYFMGLRPQVSFSVPAAVAVLLLAVLAAALGSLGPAREAAQALPAQALKAGDEELPLVRLARPWPPLSLLGVGGMLLLAPPLAGLPLGGYAAIGLFLVGGVMLMPRVARIVFGGLARRQWRPLALNLALARLAGAPGQASAALAGILASFSLMIAMAIMVGSFRQAVDDWLVRMLPADLYVRPAGGSESSWFSAADQEQLLASAVRAEFSRITPITLDPRQAPVTVIARPLGIRDAPGLLALIGPHLKDVAGRPAWISEAMRDLYAMRTGDVIELPLAGQRARLTVAGVWRDYARQFGAVVIRHQDYVEITGDTRLTDAALWLPLGISAADAQNELQARLENAGRFEMRPTDDIRALSLSIFDRSFAVTYVLTAAAILIGLFGVAATFSAQALARAREFGMLRHLGVTRGEILRLMASEGGLVSGLGAVAGLLWGVVVSLVLVYVVNPQSFHWSMDLVVPWPVILPVTFALLLTGTVTATLAGRRALGGDVLRSVRDDW
jgi:putative ABC transport system permease protein